MPIFDTEAIKNRKDAFDNREIEVTNWCAQAVSEFTYTAGQVGTELFSLNAKYAAGMPFQSYVTRRERIGIIEQAHWVELWPIMISNRFNDEAMNISDGIVVLKGGQLFLNRAQSDNYEMGATIAACCSYIQEICERVFESAFQGQPWDSEYTSKQVQQYLKKLR